MPRALITGVTGQDGSYLAELLLEKGYEVHGVSRNATTADGSRISHLIKKSEILNRRLFLHDCDLNNAGGLTPILKKYPPDEVFHLASQSHPALSFQDVISSCEITGMGAIRLLEKLRHLPKPPRVFHASSSEVFGRPETSPQDERTPFRPVTPYGSAKAFATQMAAIYRQNFGLFVSNGILFNHESPRRGENFVTQKICRAAAAIKEGRQQELVLGSLSSQRDWGDARDYVGGMWLALQHPKPEDFVFATGELHSVEEVVQTAFEAVALDWRKYVKQDPRFMRPDEPVALVGNPEKAVRLLNWKRSTSFQQLITEMTRGK